MRVPAQPHTPAPAALVTVRANMLIGRRFGRIVGIGIAAAVGVQTLPQPLQAQSREKSSIVVADASQGDWAETGTASWYGPGFAGRRTASGETYDPHNLTAAHRSLPLGSLVRVHNLDNDRHMVVRINDRGPFVKNRVIDVSQAAAEVLGFRSDGVTKVRITPVAPPPTATPAAVERTAPPAPAPSGDAPATADSSPDNSSAATTAVEDAPAFLTESTLRQHDGDSAPTGTSQYFIQLGAFRENRHAQELLQSAGPLGLALSVEAAEGMYRVVAGPFESSAAAQEAADEIQRAGLTAFVRRGH